MKSVLEQLERRVEQLEKIVINGGRERGGLN